MECQGMTAHGLTLRSHPQGVFAFIASTKAFLPPDSLARLAAARFSEDIRRVAASWRMIIANPGKHPAHFAGLC